MYVVSERAPTLAADVLDGRDSRKRRRWPWVAGAGILAASASAAVVMILPAHGAAPLPAGCTAAVTAQNVFVEAAIAEGYGSTMNMADTLATLAKDTTLLANARKAGCPANTQVEQLP